MKKEGKQQQNSSRLSDEDLNKIKKVVASMLIEHKHEMKVEILREVGMAIAAKYAELTEPIKKEDDNNYFQ